ncbi:MAG: 50S ribosomal protein L32 [bacterium]|nr:50S ribosomal protein L32 [bacterium]
MAVPKKRTSKQRKLKRRTHQVLTPVVLTQCKKCNAKYRPHHVCPNCGTYGEKSVLFIKKD